MNRTKKIFAIIELPTLPSGNKAFRCDADPNHFQKMSELQQQYPNAEIEGNVHTGYVFFQWVYNVATEVVADEDSQSLEPTVYLTGNTPITATEMMMSELPKDIRTHEIAQALLHFAFLLRSPDYLSKHGGDGYRRLIHEHDISDEDAGIYIDVAINVLSFMDAHRGGTYSTL